MKSHLEHDRIPVLDIARGMAVFGILLVNMAFFSTSLQAIQFQIELWPSVWDQVTDTVLRIFVNGKFIALFSLLFGYGLILMKERATQKGRAFTPLYSRRLLALFVFGLIHGWFIWYGDILLHYALLGFLMLFFHHRKTKTLLAWSITFFVLIPVVMILFAGVTDITSRMSPEFQQQVNEWIERDQAVYGSGTYADIQKQRMMDWNASLMNQLLFYPQLLGLFLLGAYMAKRKLLQERSKRHTLTRLCVWLGSVGFAVTLLCVTLDWVGASGAWVARFNLLEVLLAAPMMAICYLTGMTLLVNKRETIQHRLRPLANVGRMAFTNYLFQSVICTLLFYGYGLGWYGKVGPFVGVLLALAVFSIQILMSTLWLRKFRQGPLEWVWRMFTYLATVPLTKKRHPADF